MVEEPVARDRGQRPSDTLLVALTFGAGAVDAISFIALGRVFTANMTGNLVLLGLAAGSAATAELLRSVVSLVAFAVGVLCASVLAAHAQGTWAARTRVPIGIEALAQSAFLAIWLSVSGRPRGLVEVLLVAISALAMGIQSGAGRALGVRGISTTYVTGTLTGLLGQIAGGTGQTAEGARRAYVLAGLVAGAAVAGFILLEAHRVAPAVPLAVTLTVLGVALSRAR